MAMDTIKAASPVEGKERHCTMRLKRHSFVPVEDERHEWKICSSCGRKIMVRHLGCHVACWGGPAA